MHALRFAMILRHDQQNPQNTSNYILYAPQPSFTIKNAKIYEITMSYRNLKRYRRGLKLENWEKKKKKDNDGGCKG